MIDQILFLMYTFIAVLEKVIYALGAIWAAVTITLLSTLLVRVLGTFFIWIVKVISSPST